LLHGDNATWYTHGDFFNPHKLGFIGCILAVLS